MSDLRAPHRLAELAEQEASPLDELARARIRATVRREGPQVVARARTVRRVRQVATTVLPVIVLGLGMLLWPRAERRPCDAFGSEPRDFAVLDDGRQVLELARARFVAEPEARVRVETLSACQTVVRLDSGRLYVHARGLGGGELTVETPSGSAIVHGTVFSVEESSGRFAVEVAEGVVEVRRTKADPKPRATRVQKGQRFEAGQVSALEEPRVEALLALEQSDALIPDLALDDGAALEPDDEALALEDEVAPHSDEATSARRRARWARRRARARAADAAKLEQPSRAPEAKLDPKAAEEAHPDERPETGPSDGPSTETPPVPVRGPEPRANPIVERFAPAETAEALVERADACRRGGDLDCARSNYRKAGGLRGATAEAAWLALARMELSLGQGKAARQAVWDRRSRFGQGQLDVEASWILVRAHDEIGDEGAATLEAQRLVAQWPNSPQAQAAQKWLKEHAGP